MPGEALVDREDLVARATAGDRRSLSRLLSLIERGADLDLAARLDGRGVVPYTVGLTGAPGAGKSTLTDGIVATIREGGERCAVVAVDPSSPFSNGAILGDRVRLRGAHADDDGVFFRSFANRCRLGGLTGALPSVIVAFGLGGWPTVLVETVGVGQSEVEIAAWADTTVVVVTPGWGDEIQANKSGLLEIADVLVINKADRKGVGLVEGDLSRMLDLSGKRSWRPPIVSTVATEGSGVDLVWEAIVDHRRHLEESGELAERRRMRVARELREEVAAAIAREVSSAEQSVAGQDLVNGALAGELTPRSAAAGLLEIAWRSGAHEVVSLNMRAESNDRSVG